MVSLSFYVKKVLNEFKAIILRIFRLDDLTKSYSALIGQ